MTSEPHNSTSSSNDDRINSIPLSIVNDFSGSRLCVFSMAFNKKNEMDRSSGETLFSESPGNDITLRSPVGPIARDTITSRRRFPEINNPTLTHRQAVTTSELICPDFTELLSIGISSNLMRKRRTNITFQANPQDPEFLHLSVLSVVCPSVSSFSSFAHAASEGL